MYGFVKTAGLNSLEGVQCGINHKNTMFFENTTPNKVVLRKKQKKVLLWWSGISGGLTHLDSLLWRKLSLAYMIHLLNSKNPNQRDCLVRLGSIILGNRGHCFSLFVSKIFLSFCFKNRCYTQYMMSHAFTFKNYTY